jgi:hypothetical protein
MNALSKCGLRLTIAGCALGIVSVLLMVVGGLGSSGPTPIAQSELQTSQTAQTSQPVSCSFSGTGDTVTSPFALHEGSLPCPCHMAGSTTS